jgi:hypothetical protein
MESLLPNISVISLAWARVPRLTRRDRKTQILGAVFFECNSAARIRFTTNLLSPGRPGLIVMSVR